MMKVLRGLFRGGIFFYFLYKMRGAVFYLVCVCEREMGGFGNVGGAC